MFGKWLGYGSVERLISRSDKGGCCAGGPAPAAGAAGQRARRAPPPPLRLCAATRSPRVAPLECKSVGQPRV